MSGEKNRNFMPGRNGLAPAPGDGSKKGVGALGARRSALARANVDRLLPRESVGSLIARVPSDITQL